MLVSTAMPSATRIPSVKSLQEQWSKRYSRHEPAGEKYRKKGREGEIVDGEKTSKRGHRGDRSVTRPATNPIPASAPAGENAWSSKQPRQRIYPATEKLIKPFPFYYLRITP